MREYAAVEIEAMKGRIGAMSQGEMASLWRNAPVGHPYFSVSELSLLFETRFKELGGFTPELSKSIGWGS